MTKMDMLCLYAVGLVTIALPLCVQGKTWVFAVGGNRRPWNFIDDDGILKGADLDLIQAVCKVANQKCATTVVPIEACVRTVRDRFYPGEGLMERWFDACTGYVSSVDRVNALQFTEPIRTTTSTFTVLKGNPKNFNPQNLQNAVIVHLNGAFTNEQCTIRIGLGRPKQVLVASGIAEAKQLLTNRTADALFSPRTRFDDLEVLPGRYKCDINGVGMMVKKDSDLPSWWNPAFKQYYLSGKYNDACDQINQKYGGFPVRNCLPRPTIHHGVVAAGHGSRGRRSHLVEHFSINRK
ncbi:uncharacterized protein LOC125671961 isoform X2 [Ostrea edulis]|uniref:uncharacterized protein LOC125671961 isoform X2 n=1 Tax=Ostrea edulis TaxID=37623 RepID=UPI00209530E1|nr:uncharacterized protein LOC125671961 isoform X2 [Ostrea edulis]